MSCGRKPDNDEPAKTFREQNSKKELKVKWVDLSVLNRQRWRKKYRKANEKIEG